MKRQGEGLQSQTMFVEENERGITTKLDCVINNNKMCFELKGHFLSSFKNVIVMSNETDEKNSLE